MSRVHLAFASASLIALASAGSVVAQEATATAPAQAAPAAEDAVLGEIVVTARRRSESLQQVPQSVTAVTADTLQKLNIQDFDEISAVTPGLTLSTGSNGYATAASTRGVSFQQESAASPTVAFYLNDAPVETPVLFQSMFDVGQVEVLRGPQGTVRGISAPSGAITVTTRRPDLSEYGGFISATATDLQGRNVQGAINVPIIRDVLALRVAALLDQSDADGVRSVTNPLRPKSVTSAIRASVAYEPSDLFNAYVSYLHLDTELRSFVPVTGLGAGYNGPAISAGDRLSVNDDLSEITNHIDVVTVNLESRIWGQHLSYVGSYSHQKLFARENVDRGNLVPGREFYNLSYVPQERTSHEIRLASDPAPERFLDYTVGAYYSWTATDVSAPQPTANFGFFGSPFAPNPRAIDTRYISITDIDSPSRSEETSFFGSLTAHFGENTELTVGGRQIVARNVRTTTLTLLPGLFALPPGALGLPPATPCSALGTTSTYPGTCDLFLPATQIGNVIRKAEVKRPFIYNISASHRFNRDLLVYANHGTSWRAGPAVVGVFNANNDPTLDQLSSLRPETSRSYEIGLKSTLLDGRARLNVALFRQTFRNMFYRTEPVRYLSASRPGPGNPALFNFTTQVNATVEGFDIDGALQITPQWNVTAALSYADGRVTDGAIPCNAPIPAGQFVAICPYSGSTSRDPLWNATITSEYTHQMRDGVDGFVRGLFTYNPENNRRSPGSGFVVNPYSLLNVYAGIRSTDGAWEVALFAKNAFETEEQTSLDAAPYTLAGAPLVSLLGQPTNINSGYFGTTFTPRREVGVQVRYAFGSR